MKLSHALRPKPADALVVLAVVLAAAALSVFFWSRQTDGSLQAVISQNGTVTETVDLSRLTGKEERVITSNGYTLHLALTPTKVWMESSTCPNQDCVRTGVISRPGQSIVCLPARVSVVLTDSSGSGVDAVLG